MQNTLHASGADLAPRGLAANISGASWGAILAGAVAAAALSLVLMMLGTGLGLASTSPWSNHGADASTVGISAVAWVFATQIIASALGGYIAGRLRMKWPDAQTDEVFFRDTAHGLLTWAVASLLAASLLGTALANALNGGLQAGATVVASTGEAAGQVLGAAAPQVADAAKSATAQASTGDKGGGASDKSDVPVGYFVDSLFRGDQPSPAPQDAAAATAEATTILGYSLKSGQLRDEDKTRLGQLIARQTGLSQEDAERRATDIYYRVSTELSNAKAAAQGAADKARKAGAHLSLWLFVALLCGAFAASYTATIGGRQRDTWGG